MWICDGTEKQLGTLAITNKPTDTLNSELLSSLGYLIGEMRDGERYDIEMICVTSGLVRFNVCGLAQCGNLTDFLYIIGYDGVKRDIDEFYLD